MKTLLSLFVSFAFISHAAAFTLVDSTDSNMTGWEGGDVKIYVNLTNCPGSVDVVGLLNDAIAVWNNVPTSSIKVSYGGTTTGTGSSNPPTLYCTTSFGTAAEHDGVPGAAVAQSPSGPISSGYIFLNATSGAANIGNLDDTILKVVLAHEIGHLLGLGHSTSKNALMYYDATYKTNLALSQDDIDGMSYLYPSDELSNKKIAGCGSIKSIPPPSGGNQILLALFFLLPFLVFAKLRFQKS